MRHDRLQLVVPEDRANAGTDGTTDGLETSATPGPGMRLLRVVDTDEEPFPDDAA